MRIGATQKFVLEWIAQHPFYCKRTTKRDMIRRICEEQSYGEGTLYQSLHRLEQYGLIQAAIIPGTLYYDISINWNCLTLPRSVREYAPQSVKDTLEETNKKLISGEYVGVDPLGAGITKEADVDKFTEKLVESGYDKTLAKLANDDSEVEEAPEAEPEPIQVRETVEVEPTVVKTADGKQISINLTINLNL